jgi:MFS family permease
MADGTDNETLPRARWGPSLRVRDFRLWWLAQLGLIVALQMVEVAIGWQVFTTHASTMDLGLIGLAEFVPLFVLALPAGHLADLLPRRLVFAAALMIGTGVCGGLAALSVAHVTAVPAYLALAMGTGVAMAVEGPAAGAMPPTLVGPELLADAMSQSSVAITMASVIGPALGGLLYALAPAVVYETGAGLCLVATVCALAMAPAPPPLAAAAAAAGEPTEAASLRETLDGLRFMRRTPILFGAILLDLLGVLFGGAVGLLPVFASDVLHIGSVGLGILRASPAVGALLGAMWVSRRPLAHDNGRILLAVVAAFGACIVVFGLSHSFVLSLVALGVSGFVDLFSMQIRSTMAALTTPEALRGRVGAVQMVFISASNELGTFESGLAATLVGAVPAVVGGGIATIAIAISWRWLFPALARVDRLEDLAPDRPLELA